MNKRFFSASRLMGAMLCLMLALTAFTSCREDDDKDAARFTSGVINLTPAWNVTKTTAGITLNVASAEVLNTYGKYNIRVWHNVPDPDNAEETIEEDIYNETFYSIIGVDELLKQAESIAETGEMPEYNLLEGLTQSVQLTGLQEGETYHYQASAFVDINGETGEYRTDEMTFKTDSDEE